MRRMLRRLAPFPCSYDARAPSSYLFVVYPLLAQQPSEPRQVKAGLATAFRLFAEVEQRKPHQSGFVNKARSAGRQTEA
jgi:hypothetical protein